jgi:hypothetical protein
MAVDYDKEVNPQRGKGGLVCLCLIGEQPPCATF